MRKTAHVTMMQELATFESFLVETVIDTQGQGQGQGHNENANTTFSEWGWGRKIIYY